MRLGLGLKLGCDNSKLPAALCIANSKDANETLELRGWLSTNNAKVKAKVFNIPTAKSITSVNPADRKTDRRKLSSRKYFYCFIFEKVQTFKKVRV